MTVVRFKFWSSPAFEVVDLFGHPSISVRDLRAQILERANLPPSEHFDLIISSALSGDPFEDEDFQIPAGSSVIVQMVPAGRFRPSDPVLADSAGRQGGFFDTAVLEDMFSKFEKCLGGIREQSQTSVSAQQSLRDAMAEARRLEAESTDLKRQLSACCGYHVVVVAETEELRFKADEFRHQFELAGTKLRLALDALHDKETESVQMEEALPRLKAAYDASTIELQRAHARVAAVREAAARSANRDAAEAERALAAARERLLSSA